MILLAHHVEPEHLPVLAIFFVVGMWLGWQIMTPVPRLLRWLLSFSVHSAASERDTI
jgi:hypothetical protein